MSEKYLAVVEIRDQCYELHEVCVVEGLTGANELAERIEEELGCYGYEISFYKFDDPEHIIESFKYERFYPNKHIAFATHEFLDFIGNREEVIIPGME